MGEMPQRNSEIFSPALAVYSSCSLRGKECLNEKFESGGLALQDVVNQVGRRLGFQVEDGRYRGKAQVKLDMMAFGNHHWVG